MRSGGRRKSIAFFIVLGVCLVAGAVALNVGWIIVNWREAGLLIARPARLPAHHHRRRAQHHLPGARNPPQRAARGVHQRRHPRAEDAGRVDEAVPADAAEPLRRRGQAPGVLRRHAARTATGCSDTIEQVLRAGQLGAKLRRASPMPVDLGAVVRGVPDAGAHAAITCRPDALTLRDAPRRRRVVSGARRRGRAEGGGLESGRQRHQVLGAGRARRGRARAGRPGDGARCACAISGIGISPSERKRIFKRFYRIPGAMAHARQGHRPRPVHRPIGGRAPRRQGLRRERRRRARAAPSSCSCRSRRWRRNEPHSRRRGRAAPGRRPALQPRGRAATTSIWSDTGEDGAASC